MKRLIFLLLISLAVLAQGGVIMDELCQKAGSTWRNTTSGVIAVEAGELLPLCHGYILQILRSKSQVRLLDVDVPVASSPVVIDIAQFPTPPGRLAIDRSLDVVYVSFGSATRFGFFWLGDFSRVETVDTPGGSVIDIVVGLRYVFVLSSNFSDPFSNNVFVFRKVSDGSVLGPLTKLASIKVERYANYILANNDDYFWVLATGCSRFVDQSMANATIYTLQQSGVSSTGVMALDRTGSHLSSTRLDYSALNLNLIVGEWPIPQTGFAYGVSFSEDSKLFATEVDRSLFVFNVDTHSFVSETPLKTVTSCLYYTTVSVKFDVHPGQFGPYRQRVYVYATCDFDRVLGQIFWAVAV